MTLPKRLLVFGIRILNDSMDLQVRSMDWHDWYGKDRFSRGHIPSCLDVHTMTTMEEIPILRGGCGGDNG